MLENSQHWHPTMREASILKAMMPYYLATATDASQRTHAIAIAHTQVSQLIHELLTIAELNRCLEQVGFTQWLCQPKRLEQDPRTRIEMAFRVELPKVAGSLWHRLHSANHAPKLSWPNPWESACIDAKEHQVWWSIAWQWCHPQTAFTLPSGVPSGIVSWERLRSHWKGLYAMLQDAGSDETSKLVEIRTAQDPLLGNNLDQMLQQCRRDQGTLTIVVIRMLGDRSAEQPSVPSMRWWQSHFIDQMNQLNESECPRGFVTEAGDLALVYQDVDRTELAQEVRDVFSEMNASMAEAMSLAADRPAPLIAGIASVNAPSRSFRIDQLIDSAWRCLEGATVQGPGSVKSIEVF